MHVNRLLHSIVYILLGLAGLILLATPWLRPSQSIPTGRTEVEFWHFWGGRDRAVVEDIVRRFNESQDEYWVRAIAVPGNNFDAKLFLAIAGGDPPDLVNQDDPVLADWFMRGAIQPVDEFAAVADVAALRQFLLPAATRLVSVDSRMVAVPNGLDIRLLFYNRTVLQQHGLVPPRTLSEFDAILDQLTPPGTNLDQVDWVAYLPDPRRLWAWGYVFGGEFFDDVTGDVQLNSAEISAVLQWMVDRVSGFGGDATARFRRADQSLPGKTFPLLPSDETGLHGRYVFLLDGQWRVRDIEEFAARREAQNQPTVQFDACSLPYPDGEPLMGRPRSGWVNGNFFLVPTGARNSAGAWAFMKFWIGLTDPSAAAETCIAGGWIPVSNAVIESPRYREYLPDHPLMARFVHEATSDALFPYPMVPGAMFFQREVNAAAEYAPRHSDADVSQILSDAQRRIQSHLNANGPATTEPRGTR